MQFVLLIMFIRLLFVCLFVVSSTIFAQKEPKLVVGIVIDQMRYDYLGRFASNFSQDGFLKILRKGVNCTNINYNYVPTYTGPGHASIYTGTTPKNHGIIANDWFDQEKRVMINCVQDNSVSPIGSFSSNNKRSPIRLKTTTITDELKITNPESKVISVSIKDRGAILPGGHLSNGTYWYDYSSGNFVTSSFFRNNLPDWLIRFNKENSASVSIKNWGLLLEEEKYKSNDESNYEALLLGKEKPIFPYLFENSQDKNTLFPASPSANTVLTSLAIEALEKEKLGMDVNPDFLTISYSSTDIVGHLFGTDSREVEDMYLRLDLEIARLLKYLDKTVGKKNYLIFITADHAAVPVPQSLLDRKLPGGYLFLEEKVTELNEKLRIRFSTEDTLILKLVNNQVYLDQDLMNNSLKNKADSIINYIKEQIETWPGVKEVYSRPMLLQTTAEPNSFHQMVSNGYHSRQSGEIAFVLDYGYLLKSSDSPEARKGTSHGSPYKYDTHVPLLWYGFGLPKKTIHTTYNITDIVPSLERVLHIQGAGSSFNKPIIELFNP